MELPFFPPKITAIDSVSEFRKQFRAHYKQQAGIAWWSMIMIEKQRVPGSSPAWKRKDYFPPVLRPTVNWELVARHEENMDAVNGILGLWPLAGELIHSPPTALGAASAPWSFKGGGVPMDAESPASSRVSREPWFFYVNSIHVYLPAQLASLVYKSRIIFTVRRSPR